MAVPSTQFRQEYESNSDLVKYAADQGIDFTLLGLADVNGASAHPLYNLLKQATDSGDIGWNFGSYFLVDRQGGVQRFDKVSPKDLTAEIQAKLADTSPSSL